MDEFILPAIAYNPTLSEQRQMSLAQRRGGQSATGVRDPGRTKSKPEHFDELYDISSSECEEVPLRCSLSIIKPVTRQEKKRASRPSIQIASSWSKAVGPKAKDRQLTSTNLLASPSPKMAVPESALSKISRWNERSLGVSETPSLVESMTSDELADISCPSTPDLSTPDEQDINGWVSPIQLHPDALELLHHLSAGHSISPIEASVADAREMSEVPARISTGGPDSPSLITPRNRVAFDTAADDDEAEPISALSVPSPGGFFASLKESAAELWDTALAIPVPSTTVAESFYNVPWQPEENTEPKTPTTARGSMADGSPESSRPSVTRIESYVSTGVNDIAEIAHTEVEHIEKYEAEIWHVGSANLHRTFDWLNSQTGYGQAAEDRDTSLDVETAVASIPKRSVSVSQASSHSSPNKKSVRFADERPSPDVFQINAAARSSVFYKSFQSLGKHAAPSDLITYRESRADAVNIKRAFFKQKHIQELTGQFEIVDQPKRRQLRAVSMFKMPTLSEENSEAVHAQQEVQATEQLEHCVWHLQALRSFTGGCLLTSPAGKLTSKRGQGLRILDLGGEASCDWAWQVAIDFPQSTVYTATESSPASRMRGPKNHRIITVPNIWTLPFPSDYFDIISARTLFALLKTHTPAGENKDGYDLCLGECFRCLKPGGYFEYSLMDADMMNAGAYGTALSVEFGFNLKTRGYDPAPTKVFIPRLRRAGFGTIRRAWMVLPACQNDRDIGENAATAGDMSPSEKVIQPNGDVIHLDPPTRGSTASASFLTGLLGAWMWEKWVLKLQTEMGKDHDKLLAGTNEVLQEAGAQGAGWRYLTGWARK